MSSMDGLVIVNFLIPPAIAQVNTQWRALYQENGDPHLEVWFKVSHYTSSHVACHLKILYMYLLYSQLIHVRIKK